MNNLLNDFWLILKIINWQLYYGDKERFMSDEEIKKDIEDTRLFRGLPKTKARENE